MNEGSRWRLQIADRIAPLYAANPKVAAVIVGGSTARGHADQYSDIEMGVFWHEPPADSERRSVIEHAGADLIRLYPYDTIEEVWCDDFSIGRLRPEVPNSGVMVEAVHYTSAFVWATIDAVLSQYDPDELKQNLLSGILDGLALSGYELVAEWKARAATYPCALAAAVVRKHATIDHFWRWEMWLKRGDNRMMVYQAFSQVEQKILHILLALNRVYYFGLKWIDVVLDRLEVCPGDCSARLKRIYHVEPTEGAQQLAALVEDTYDLIEAHLPEIDVEWLRRVFRYRRPIWEQAPALCYGRWEAG